MVLVEKPGHEIAHIHELHDGGTDTQLHFDREGAVKNVKVE